MTDPSEQKNIMPGGCYHEPHTGGLWTRFWQWLKSFWSKITQKGV